MNTRSHPSVIVTVVGGPTALIDVGGFRFLTDPTFDQPGRDYPGSVTLTKTGAPALSAEGIGHIDAVLLSHDQHADNLDEAGRALLPRVRSVLSTASAAGRLGSAIIALAPWQTVDLDAGLVGTLRITATPARHGPAGIEPIAGEVIGFVVTHVESGTDLLYITGDTCWFEGVAEVSRRFRPETVLLFGGAARTRGPFDLTMNTNDAIETAAHFPKARILPLHHTGWKHFTQTEDDLKRSFTAVGRGGQLVAAVPGVPVVMEGSWA